MTRQIIFNVVRFFVLILFQIAILNNVRLSGYINPYLYVLFILALPFRTPGWLLLLLAFAMGLTIDIFSHTLGFHISACVMMAYFRPYILQLISTHEEYPKDSAPSANEFGFNWFIRYALILVSIHHVILFFVEMYRFTDILQTLVRIIVSIVFTLSLIILSEYLFPRK